MGITDKFKEEFDIERHKSIHQDLKLKKAIQRFRNERNKSQKTRDKVSDKP